MVVLHNSYLGIVENKDENKIEILVIENSPNITSIIKKTNSLKKYHFIFLKDGLSGLNYLQSNHKYPSLIIIVNNLSSYGGVEILNKTREVGLKLKFLIISKEDSAIDAVNAIKAGAIDYIVDNPNLEFELPNIIEKAIRNSHSIINGNLSFIDNELGSAKGALAQIADHIPVFISLVNNELEYLFVNRMYENFFNIKKSEIIGKKVKEIIGRDAFDRAYPNIVKALAGQSHTFDNHLVNKKGEDRVIRTTYTPYYQNNKIDGLIILVIDITEQKQAEESLLESEQLYHSMFDKTQAIKLIIDPLDGSIIDANPAAVQFYGYSLEQLKMLNISKINTLSASEILIEMADAASEQRSYFNFKHRLASGVVRDVEVYSSPITIGRRNLLHSIIHDITDRKVAEEKLIESELKYRIVADNTSDWEFWVSPEGKFLYTSPSCLRITGYEPSNFIDDPELEQNIVHPEDLNKLKNHIEHVDKEKIASGIDYRIILPNGQIKWISHKCQPVFGRNNEYLGIRGSNRDVTDKKLAEIEIEESNKKLKEINSSKDKFFSIIAHDLINPFNTLLGFSELLMDNIQTYSHDKIENQVQIINEAAKSCYSLLDNLLTWSRSQIGSIEINPSHIDLEIITLDIIKQFHPLTHRKQINIISTITSKTVAYADENMVKTIIRNLISNAIKFTRIGGIVVLSTSEKNGCIEYCVEDNGVGIAIDVIDNLFHIDRNISTTGTEKEKGSGLGLILCKDFVVKNGGKIWVKSELGCGSEFIFTLPKGHVNH